MTTRPRTAGPHVPMVSSAVPISESGLPPHTPPSMKMTSYCSKSAAVIDRHIASEATVTTVPAGNHEVRDEPPGP